MAHILCMGRSINKVVENGVGSGGSVPAGLKRSLILLATTTEEKIAQYNAICLALGLPVQFRRLNELVEAFHAADEDKGDRLENAKQKFGEIHDIVALLRDRSSSYQAVLREKCRQWDIPFLEDSIFIATEDSTFTTPKPIWDILKVALRDYVPDVMLQNADKYGQETGPGAETGPILAAVGMTRFFNLLREAAIRAGYTDEKVLLNQLVTFIMTRLGDAPTQPAIFLEASVPTFLHVPLGLGQKITDPAKPLFISGDYYHTQTAPGIPVGDRWKSYLVEESDRAEIVKLIMEVIAADQEKPSVASHATAAAHSMTSRRKIKKNAKNILQLVPTEPAPLGGYKPKQRITPVSGSGLAILGMEKILKEGDALVFPPFNPADLAERRLNYYRLLSAIVEKQHAARTMYVPIIVMDDGCWRPILDWLFKMSRFGLGKDFIRPPFYDGVEQIVSLKGVRHTATQYLDILQGEDVTTLGKAAGQVIRFRMRNYRRFISPNAPHEKRTGGKPAPEGLFRSAVFISASSDSRALLKAGHDYGEHLAETGCGLVWGGADRHGMGAPYDGYRRKQGSWLAGFSTPTLIKAETKYGMMPYGCHYWELSEFISDRMLGMIHNSDMLVGYPGYGGTNQEAAAFFIMKDRAPELAAGKNFVWFSPDMHAHTSHPGELFWMDYLRISMGDDVFEQLAKDHTRFAADGLWLATRYDEMIEMHDHLHRQHNARLRPALACKPVPPGTAAPA
jgi:hypothetical protein